MKPPKHLFWPSSFICCRRSRSTVVPWISVRREMKVSENMVQNLYCHSTASPTFTYDAEAKKAPTCLGCGITLWSFIGLNHEWREAEANSVHVVAWGDESLHVFPAFHLKSRLTKQEGLGVKWIDFNQIRKIFLHILVLLKVCFSPFITPVQMFVISGDWI